MMPDRRVRALKQLLGEALDEAGSKNYSANGSYIKKKGANGSKPMSSGGTQAPLPTTTAPPPKGK